MAKNKLGTTTEKEQGSIRIILIKDIEFKVNYVSNDELNEVNKKMGFINDYMVYDGMCNHTNHTLYINENLQEAQRKQTLYHECMHMIDSLLNDDILDMMNNEEGFVRWLTANMHYVNQVYKQIYESEAN